MLDLINLDPAAKQAARAFLPHFEYLLDDISGIDVEQLLDRKLTPSALITLLLLKSATGNPDLARSGRRGDVRDHRRNAPR